MKRIEYFETTPVVINGAVKKKRVCAYCRVSSKKEEQSTSLELQVSTYYKQITSNPDYEFAGIFADRGKSGTNTNYRDQFKLMYELAMIGEIDLILTKSISRFARNTIDCIKTIQELRLNGVEVFFEKENISSLDPNFDFYLTVLSSVAEEESKQVSTNCNWSIKKRFQSGMNFTWSLYGYDIDSDGNYTIIEDEARVIKKIFDMYLGGSTIPQIIKWLKVNNITSPKGREEWSKNTIKDILHNEKYAGNMMLQKTYRKIIGKKGQTKNNNIKPKYLVTGNHQGIISREDFKKVQDTLKERADKFLSKNGSQNKSDFALYVYSPVIHKHLSKKVNNRGKSYETVILQGFDSKNPECRPVFVRSLELLLISGISELLRNFRLCSARVKAIQEDKLTSTGLREKLNKQENLLNELQDKISMINQMESATELKVELLSAVYDEKSIIENEYVKLKFSKLIDYDYSKKMKLLKKRLSTINTPLDSLEGIDYKSIFEKVIAIDRDNLILCLHLSNTPIDNIDLDSAVNNTPIASGTFEYQQTRLTLDMKWSIIVI